jgi:hypothetical protein
VDLLHRERGKRLVGEPVRCGLAWLVAEQVGGDRVQVAPNAVNFGVVVRHLDSAPCLAKAVVDVNAFMLEGVQVGDSPSRHVGFDEAMAGVFVTDDDVFHFI